MSKRSADELIEIGLKSLGPSATQSEERIIRAVAAMLPYASGRPRRKASEPLLPVSPSDVFKAIQATRAVLCEPVDQRWFGRLGGLLKNVRVEVGDIEVLVAWLTSGGVAGWPQGKPTFTQLLQHLDKWLAFSREWDRLGRQELKRGGTNIGIDNPSAADLSSFKAPRVE